MPWPSLSDYNEAVQNPRHNFSDPELQGGTVRTNPLGLPIPISGGFATVYQVQAGARIWAVRCFQREISDQQQRYVAISRHLAAARLPYTVGFTYLPQGIRVRGEWYPVLKMEWVSGDPLNAYVEKNLRNPGVLLKLANQFLAMVTMLQQAHVAHGDLQRGNILVSNGNLKLIDYDGMYVPALAGFRSHETGHRNYQHPKRDASHFGIYLDNFSSWVIYLSIVALSIDPCLWQKAKAGEEKLLFCKDDFEKPQASTILTLLANHTNPRLQGLASLFASALYAEPPLVPTIHTAQFGVPELTQPGASSPAADWLKDHLKVCSSPTAAPVALPAQASTDNIGWVLDFVSPPQTHKHFGGHLGYPRLSLLTFLAAVTAVFVFHIPLLYALCLVAATATIVAVTLFACYRSDPTVAEKMALLSELKQSMTARAEIDRALAAIDEQIAALRADYNETREKLGQERIALQRKAQQELNEVKVELSNTLRSIDLALQELDTQIHRVRADMTARTGGLQQQILELDQAEAIEISNSIRAAQQQFVADYLRSCRISGNNIPGIGPTLVARLASWGYATAADINWGVTNVPGIGASKAASLMRWRQDVERRAIGAMPQSLTPAQMNTIQAKYSTKRMQLQQSITSIIQTAQQQEQALRTQHAFRRQQLEEARCNAQTRAQQRSQAIAGRYQQASAALTEREAQASAQLAGELKKIEADAARARRRTFEANWRIAKVRRSLEPYRRISFLGYIQQAVGITRKPS
ncbi:MAG TPA: hypothetical protein VNL98_04100 [Gemmatimonadales bacterium]|nr:hypothetical protein [Gemmatimonadales bacterium]